MDKNIRPLQPIAEIDIPLAYASSWLVDLKNCHHRKKEAYYRFYVEFTGILAAPKIDNFKIGC